MNGNSAQLTNYGEAISAYKQKTQVIRYSLMLFALLSVASLFIWPESSLSDFIAVSVAVVVILYVIWRRRVWKKLEIEHGLING